MAMWEMTRTRGRMMAMKLNLNAVARGTGAALMRLNIRRSGDAGPLDSPPPTFSFLRLIFHYLPWISSNALLMSDS